MKLLLVLLIMTFTKLIYSQTAIFGTYELKTSLVGDTISGTFLILKCDYTYYRADNISRDWGTWKLKENEEFVLQIDTMAANGRVERHRVNVYYQLVNGKLKLAEREYSKKTFKKNIKEINESLKNNKETFIKRYSYNEEEYEKWRVSSMGLYFEKSKSLICQ